MKILHVYFHQPVELPELGFTPYRAFGIHSSDPVTKNVEMTADDHFVHIDFGKPGHIFSIPWANVRYAKVAKEASTPPGDVEAPAEAQAAHPQGDPVAPVPKTKRGPGRQKQSV